MSADNNNAISKEASGIVFHILKKQMFSRMKFPASGAPQPPFDNVRIMDSKADPLPLFVPIYITTKTYVKSTVASSVLTVTVDTFSRIVRQIRRRSQA